MSRLFDPSAHFDAFFKQGKSLQKIVAAARTVTPLSRQLERPEYRNENYRCDYPPLKAMIRRVPVTQQDMVHTMYVSTPCTAGDLRSVLSFITLVGFNLIQILAFGNLESEVKGGWRHLMAQIYRT